MSRTRIEHSPTPRAASEGTRQGLPNTVYHVRKKLMNKEHRSSRWIMSPIPRRRKSMKSSSEAVDPGGDGPAEPSGRPGCT